MEYHCPSGVDEKSYHRIMLSIQRKYNFLIKNGAPVEAARGILPLNINSPITMTLNFRSLVHMLELRMCENAQGEFKIIADLMAKEIAKKVSDDFANIFLKPPCEKYGFCNSPAPCKKVTLGRIPVLRECNAELINLNKGECNDVC
jgi:thymidylate synthase (FAD)